VTIAALPATVGSEVRSVIHAALEAGGIGFRAIDRPPGPAHSSVQRVAQVVAETEQGSPYLRFAYCREDGTSLAGTAMGAPAAAIIEVADGDQTGPGLTFGWKAAVPADPQQIVATALGEVYAEGEVCLRESVYYDMLPDDDRGPGPRQRR
jgi:hypothetical protein